jgi:hypothetical protein
MKTVIKKGVKCEGKGRNRIEKKKGKVKNRKL